jgi:hypothetical protein
MRRIHLDTDIGGDTDDLCALAMLLGWADVELVGVTTCTDSGGLRAGLARYALRLAGQEGVPARLIARQGELYGADSDMTRVGTEHPGLPDDLLNFQYDPLACAVAAGWDGARVEELRLSAQPNDGVLGFPESPSGKPTRVVTGVDGPRLEREWTQAVRAVGRVE